MNNSARFLSEPFSYESFENRGMQENRHIMPELWHYVPEIRHISQKRYSFRLIYCESARHVNISFRFCG